MNEIKKPRMAEMFDNDSASLSRIDKQINYVIDLIHEERTSRHVTHQSGVYKKLVQDLNTVLYTALGDIQITQASLVLPESLREYEPF